MNGNSKIDDQIGKDILKGKYRDCYLIYNRKSTDDTESQKNSIKYQKSENARFAFREHLPIAALTLDGFATEGVVSERHSGFKEDITLTFGADNMVQYRVERPKFHRLVQMLNAGHFKGVIFLCWDRASRNKGDDTILRKLMKAGVDMRFSLAQYDRTSAGELHMDIDGMFAEHHSRVTREKVGITIRNARARGLCTHKAGVGYLNEGSMEHKPIDPVRAPLIRQMAELAATGEWTLADLARWLVEQGFTMPPIRRRRTQDEILAEEEDDVRLELPAVSRLPTFNSVHKILTNPIYTGKVLGNDGVWVLGTSHEAIIPQDLFDKVQLALKKRRISAHYQETLDHPLRGIARCAICHRVYTPYTKKGHLYYGARCARECTNPRRNISFEYLATEVGKLIRNLAFTDDQLAKIDAQASTDIALLDIRRMDRLDTAERKKKKLREDLGYLNANRLPLLKSGAYTPEQLVAEQAELSRELDLLKDAEDVSDVSMAATVQDSVTLSELLKMGADWYDFAKPGEKDRIIRIVFSELTVAENTLQYQCKNSFKALASRFLASSDRLGWLSELLTYSEEIKSDIRLLEELLMPNDDIRLAA